MQIKCIKNVSKHSATVMIKDNNLGKGLVENCQCGDIGEGVCERPKK